MVKGTPMDELESRKYISFFCVDGEDALYQVVGFDFFDCNIGYTPVDLEAIAKLKLGESVNLSQAARHYVMRVN